VSAINFHTKEISVKIVYYGPGLCGKTTSLQSIYATIPEHERPQLVSLATDVDRTIFFDFLPLTAYRIRDFKVRLQLYTVPGQVFYNATRKLVLNGVDGIVFVADSQRAMQDSNLESLQNLEENLAELGLDLDRVPMVMQFNKRDLGDTLELAEMDRIYNTRQVPVFATIATSGEGLFDVLKTISQSVVNDLIRKGLGQQLRQQEKSPPAKPPDSADSFSAGYSTVEEAVTKATHQQTADLAAPKIGGQATQTGGQATKTAGSLWPSREAHRLGTIATGAVERGAWQQAILAVDELLEFSVGQWASNEGRSAADALATFLFLRGVTASRYRHYMQSLLAARTEKPLSRGDAVNAVILALEALW